MNVNDLLQEVSGEDWVGASLPRLPAMRTNKVLAQGGAPAGKVETLSQSALGHLQPQVFLGSNSVAAVGAGLTVAVNSASGALLRITDLIVSDGIANDFDIMSIQVGRLNLLASGDPIPASAFRSAVQRPPIEVPRLHPGQQITIQVRNNAGAVRVWSAMFVGIDLSTRVY